MQPQWWRNPGRKNRSMAMASVLNFWRPHLVRRGRETEFGGGRFPDGKLPGSRAGRSGEGPKMFCPYGGGWPVVPTATSKTNSLVEPVRSFLCHHVRLHRGTVRRPSACHVNLCAVTLTVSYRSEPCGRRTAAAGIFQNDRLIGSAPSLPPRKHQPGLRTGNHSSRRPVAAPMGETPHGTGGRYFLESDRENSPSFPKIATQTANSHRCPTRAGLPLKVS